MTFTKVTRWGGGINILSGVLMLTFWFLFPILLPYGPKSNQAMLVVDKDFLSINLAGVAGAVFALLGLVTLYAVQIEKTGALGLWGFLIAFCGLALMLGWLCWESIIWTAICKTNLCETLLDPQSGIYSNSVVMAYLIVAGTLYSIGFMIFGVASYRAKILPRWASMLLIVGTPIYGFGALIGSFWPQVIVRTTGLLLREIGIIWLGLALWKGKFMRPGG